MSAAAANNQVATTDQKEWIPSVGETVLHGMEVMTVEAYNKEHPGYLTLTDGTFRSWCMTRSCVRPTQANLNWTTLVVAHKNVLQSTCINLNGSEIYSYFEQRWREGIDATELIKADITKRLIEFVKAVTIAYCVSVDGIKLFR